MADYLVHLVVGALIRRGDEVLLVRQQGPNDPSSAWALPGGVVESGELLTESLAREVREETGLEVQDPGQLVYVAQFHNPLPEQLHQGKGPGGGYLLTAFVFETSAWSGDIFCDDPDQFVSEAQFMPLATAISRLEELSFRVMCEPVVAYLHGQVPRGAMWFYRRQTNGTDSLIARVLEAC